MDYCDSTWWTECRELQTRLTGTNYCGSGNATADRLQQRHLLVRSVRLDHAAGRSIKRVHFLVRAWIGAANWRRECASIRRQFCVTIAISVRVSQIAGVEMVALAQVEQEEPDGLAVVATRESSKELEGAAPRSDAEAPGRTSAIRLASLRLKTGLASALMAFSGIMHQRCTPPELADARRRSGAARVPRGTLRAHARPRGDGGLQAARVSRCDHPGRRRRSTAWPHRPPDAADPVTLGPSRVTLSLRCRPRTCLRLSPDHSRSP